MSPYSANIADNGTFLDANILLEIILDRGRSQVARNLLRKHSGGLVISALTAHLVVHFGQALVDLPILRRFLGDYTVLSLEAADFEWAFVNTRDRDFEDGLQLGVAIRHSCNRFITFDKTLFGLYQNLPAIKIEVA